MILIPGDGTPNILLDAELTTSTSGGVTSIKLNQNPFGITSYPKITIASPEGLNFKGVPILRVIRDPIVQDTSKLIQVTDLVGLKKTGYYDGRIHIMVLYSIKMELNMLVGMKLLGSLFKFMIHCKKVLMHKLRLDLLLSYVRAVIFVAMIPDSIYQELQIILSKFVK